MMKAVEFNNVSIVFGERPETALPMMDDGKDRTEIQKATGQVLGVHNCSLDVEAGEILVLMGLSGSGKSTLLRAVNGLNPVVRGGVTVHDGDWACDVGAAPATDLRRLRRECVSMVFQQFGLLPWRTVRDNVGLGLELGGMDKSARNKKVDEQLELVGLADRATALVGELSGGMQQRVGLARALAADPEILLMDEPFSALDPLIRRQLQGEFMGLAANMNKTTVFITHDLDEAVRIGDRIAIMRDGMVIQTGTPEDIVMNPVDDYVSDFVAGISRLKVVRAHAVMQPLAAFESANGSLAATAKEFPEDAHLGDLIGAAITSDQPAAIINATGQRIGVITRSDLLRTVIEGTETS